MLTLAWSEMVLPLIASHAVNGQHLSLKLKKKTKLHLNMLGLFVNLGWNPVLRGRGDLLSP